MKKSLITAIVSTGLLFGTAAPSVAATYHRSYYRQEQHRSYYRQEQHRRYVEHKRHMKTAKRVGIGAVGGAVVGGLVGGGKGAGIGAIAGAGAGALYDRHEKHTGHY